jgi:hypothetical protein
MRLWSSIPLTLFLGVVGLLVGSPTTTTASAATFTCDAPVLARLDAHASALAEAGQGTRLGVRDGSASPSAEGRGASTTAYARSVATEAAIGFTDDAVGTPYQGMRSGCERSVRPAFCAH